MEVKQRLRGLSGGADDVDGVGAKGRIEVKVDAWWL